MEPWGSMDSLQAILGTLQVEALIISTSAAALRHDIPSRHIKQQCQTGPENCLL